ncbi:MAG: hypothetical protein M1837_006494 [Sclerophora amabilis]|nr:MAG: hypothetical protein M1837_006494 [Sclerophora amabilis]
MADQKKYTSKFESAHVLVIGGSSGLGFCVAEASLENGARVTISSSQQSRVDAAIERLLKSYPSAKDRISGHPCDLSGEDVDDQVKGLFEKTGKVDHIAVTAGDKIAPMKVKDFTVEAIHKYGAVRFVAPLMIAKHAPEYLSGGPRSSITFTSGTVSEKPLPDWSVVAAYAAAGHGMVRNLALDLKPIRVNLICPGPVDTEFWDFLPANARNSLIEASRQQHLTGVTGRPEDVAEAFLYSIRDQNLTGSVIRTEGGSTIS